MSKLEHADSSQKLERQLEEHAADINTQRLESKEAMKEHEVEREEFKELKDKTNIQRKEALIHPKVFSQDSACNSATNLILCTFFLDKSQTSTVSSGPLLSMTFWMQLMSIFMSNMMEKLSFT